MEKKKEQVLKTIYFDAEKSPVTFTGSRAVYNFLTKEFGIKINFKDVKAFEKKIRAFQSDNKK